MNKVVVGAALAGLLAIGALALALGGPAGPAEEPHDQRFGLMTSLPIYRAPQASVADMLDQAGDEAHWLRSAVEAHNTLEPLDLLDAKSLARIDTLLLVQPRALTPAEYVALDDWVRGGGKVLLVADPMLTSEPHFALGDPRNPQAVSLSGPILARWGLELVADEGEGHGHNHGIDGDEAGHAADHEVELDGYTLPVTYGGTFEKRPPAGGDPADCSLRNAGLIAVCQIVEGRAVVVADATVFERNSGSGDAADVFWALLGMMRDAPGE